MRISIITNVDNNLIKKFTSVFNSKTYTIIVDILPDLKVDYLILFFKGRNGFIVDETQTNETFFERCAKILEDKSYLQIKNIIFISPKIYDERLLEYDLCVKKNISIIETFRKKFNGKCRIINYSILFDDFKTIFKDISNYKSYTIIGYGNNRMNPIHIKDIAKLIEKIIKLKNDDCKDIEIGGIDILKLDDILKYFFEKTGQPKYVWNIPIQYNRAKLGIIGRIDVNYYNILKTNQLINTCDVITKKNKYFNGTIRFKSCFNVKDQ